MMVNDTIADMLTRIRNANQMKYAKVSVLNTKMTREIAAILKEEGYISNFEANAESIMIEDLENGSLINMEKIRRKELLLA